MYPILLEIGKFKLYSFGTFIALGAITGGALGYWLAKRRRLKTHHIFDSVLYSLLFGLIAARIGYYFTYFDQFRSWKEIFYFWQGGLLALPALVVGFAVYIYILKKGRVLIWSMLDIAALGLLLGWGVGKVGCQLSSCNIGRPASGIFSISGSYPVDLFSIVWAIFLFVVLLSIYFKNRLTDGVVFFLSLEGLFLGELLIKTLRADFGEGIARIEALIYLGIIIGIYFVFWKVHGPKIERRSFAATLKNLVFRRRN